MCGIYGFAAASSTSIASDAGIVLATLARFSDSRGKEASGFAAITKGEIHVYKCPWPSDRLVRSAPFTSVLGQQPIGLSGVSMAVGHSRLVTNGYEGLNTNNQPVVSTDLVGVHNGIVVNYADVWRRRLGRESPGELDSEVIPALIEKYIGDGYSLPDALRQVYGAIEGQASVALIFRRLNALVLATNNGSLYTVEHADRTSVLFTSERSIMLRAIRSGKLGTGFTSENVRQIAANQAVIFDGATGALTSISLLREASDAHEMPSLASPAGLTIRDWSTPDSEFEAALPRRVNRAPDTLVRAGWMQFFEGIERRIEALRRCTRCLLPSSFPYITFDASGVCNFCLTYQPINTRGRDALESLFDSMPPAAGATADCVVSFSGGRDSCYVLYYLKQVMGRRPIAFTYDWGMITDLGRRNQSRLCAKLGVEHVLMSADIRHKRANIRANVLAWLKRPHLGAVPLFMAGDKQFFYYAQQLRTELGVPLLLLGENQLERTNFKSGYCGVKPNLNQEHIYSLSLGAKARMGAFYLGEYLRNPAYLNRSLLDTAGAFASYYVIAHNYTNFFDYIPWGEETVDDILRTEMNWEVADDLPSTWRIGDGTAAFYNYIYYTVGGFSEFDTFRSNQIREGQMTREHARDIARRENQPRFESIRWYCDTIGIDFEDAVSRINAMPRQFA